MADRTAGNGATELRSLLRAALTEERARLSPGMLVRQVPPLLGEGDPAAQIGAALDSVEDWTLDALLDAVCSVDVDAAALARVRGYLDGLPPLFPLPHKPPSSPDAYATMARANMELLADPAYRAAMEAAGVPPPPIPTEEEIASAERRARGWALDQQLRAHGDGRRFTAAERARILTDELRRVEAALRDLRISDEQLDPAIAALDRAWLAWSRRSPTERGADLEIAMLFSEAIAEGASIYSEGLGHLPAAAVGTLVAFRNRAPAAAARLGFPFPAENEHDDPPEPLVEAVGNVVALWQGRGGRRRKGTPATASNRRGEAVSIQWEAVASFLRDRFGYAPRPHTLANEWSRRSSNRSTNGRTRPRK